MNQTIFLLLYHFFVLKRVHISDLILIWINPRLLCYSFRMSNLKKPIILVGILALSLFGAGCRKSWIGFYYPDPINLSVYEQSPELSTLEECRNWVENQRLLKNKNEGEYDYECGSGCKYKSDAEYYVCENTVK